MTKRFLVYTSCNGRVHSAFHYGEVCKPMEKSMNETLQVIEISDHTLTLEQAIKMYPVMEKVIRNEQG